MSDDTSRRRPRTTREPHLRPTAPPTADDEEKPVGRFRPPPAREAVARVYCTLALTFVYYHGTPASLPPTGALFAWFGITFLVLFCGPALIVTGVWKKPLGEFGLRRGDSAVWGRYLVFFLAVMLPVVLIASRTPTFHAYYPRCLQARTSLAWLALSAMGWLVYFFAWEWFFRGFLLSTLAPRYGGGIAILMQTIPFVMMHYPKVEAEAWSSIIAGLALGLMAFRGRSFLGTWLLHWLVATSMDFSVVFWPLN
jgi:membrane protease YdiL (CAAX protease family)